VISVRPYLWLMRLAVVLAIAALSPGVGAQDEDEPDEETGAGDQLVRRPLVTDRQFDLQIFGNADSARERMNLELNRQLNRLDRQYRLTDSQKKKLFLAGQGDIKRAFDRVDELRRKFQLAKYERTGAMECLQEARRMRSYLLGGMFGADSLLTKTAATTISEEQKAYEDDLLRESFLVDYRGAVAEAASRLVRVLNLTPEQHRQFKKLLMDEIRPPRRSGESTYAYIMYQLSRLPETKVRPIFDDSQWKFLHELLMSWNDGGKFLQNDGFILDQAPPARPRRVAVPLVQRKGQTGQ